MSPASPSSKYPQAWSPLRHRAFRMLWFAWLAANLCMWMNEFAGGWLMSSLSGDPLLVALVRSAATLPSLLLALPSGALADMLDRRSWFVATQLWVAASAALLAAAVWTGAVSPPILLCLLMAYGAGLPLRWPVWAAIVPDLVPRSDLPQAMALNGVAANLSRVIGPVIAGALLAWIGTGCVFGLNALLALGSAAVIWRWRPSPREIEPSAEPFVRAMRDGVRYAAASRPVRIVLLHTFVFFLQSTALLALLPLIAKGLGGGEGTYTLLMAGMSASAVATIACSQLWRSRMCSQTIVRGGTALYAVGVAVVAWAPSRGIAVLATIPLGAAWIAVSSVLSTSAQLALPDWVRARGMSLFLMSVMAGNAAGAALWGFVARTAGVPYALMAASAAGLVLVVAMWRIELRDEATSAPI